MADLFYTKTNGHSKQLSCHNFLFKYEKYAVRNLCGTQSLRYAKRYFIKLLIIRMNIQSMAIFIKSFIIRMNPRSGGDQKG